MGNQHKNQSFNIQEASKNNLLGEKLAKARKEQKIRQGEFVRLLKDYGIDMSSSSYSCWETGARTPNAYQLLALCRALEIDDTNAEAHGLRAWCCETVDLSDLSVVDDLRHKAEEDKQKMKSLRGKKK